MANPSTKAHLAGSNGIRLQDDIRIERPVEDVFDFWRDLTNLPRFMAYVERIDLRGDGVSHWVIKGPGGVTLEWDARSIHELRPHLIAWESIGSPDVVSAGSVKFTPLAAAVTNVDVRLQYDPPAGKVGAGMAKLVGLSPATVLRDDLRRLKILLESSSWRSGIDVGEVWLHGRGGA
jgi:uncharacterized membrane protein